MSAERISSKQIFILLSFCVFGTIFFTLPRTLTDLAGHSGWLSILIAGLMFLPFMWMLTRIGFYMKEEPFIPFCLRLLGPMLGRLFALLVLLPLVVISAMTLRVIAELFISLVLPETPIELVLALLLILRYYLTLGGISAIARWAEIVIPGIAVTFITLCALSINNVELSRIEPLFNASFGEVFRGAVVILSGLTEMLFLLFVWPNLRNKHGVFAVLLYADAVLMAAFLIIYLLSIGTYGSALTAHLTYPFIEMVKDINIFEFIQHLESIFLALCIFMNLTKGSFTFYMILIGCKDWFGASSYRPLMLPVTLIMFYLALVPQNLYLVLIEYEKAKGLTFSAYAYALAAILLLAAKLKSRGTRHEQTG
ncbi:GerAB/ArcD/ProY family transporter [Paenibacillus sp. y28]|uniref:GerAB/ArcD/ProY family transporter n=1 Tax=Paenibacillus sp. y28 TaxID=3129110 RepID=UPI003019D43A